MPFKDLLVHLDATEAGARRLDYALRLAAREEAHLAGVYTIDLVPQLSQLARAYPGRVEHYEIFIETRRAAFDQAKRVEAQFRDALRRQGIEGEWRLVEGAPAERMTAHARYVDLAVVGQIDPAQGSVSDEDRIPEELLLASGRPLLIVPFAGQFETVGENIVVAWKATAEAARAVAAALPLLERAKKVTVLTVNPDRDVDAEPGLPVADIALHLARHGVRAEAATITTDDVTTGDALLNHTTDCGADLLVMGGYGHSRARETLFGGVTRQILRQMIVPVVMAH